MFGCRRRPARLNIPTMMMRRSGRTGLDPAGRIRLPRRGTMLRSAMVAVLLLTAAGALYGGVGGTDPPSPPEPPEQSPPPAAARLSIPDGLVGVPVPLGTPAGLAMLQPGDRVDLLAVPDGGGGDPAVLAGNAAVLGVDRPDATLFLALTPRQAHAVVSSTSRFAVIVRP